AVVVAVILGLIVFSSVKRQRKSLGILKGMGYSSRDLRRQMALKIMPVTIVSVIIASVLTGYVYSAFWMMAFSAVGTVTIPVIVIADVVLVAFCYVVTYLCAGKIKSISVTELMTE
ncbi:MAG: FtsX-like permease family protein, partial [Oscillospiraceae bacterium]|nr:FtsX-like permease family protein [Oscillospiraceae bacterium]